MRPSEEERANWFARLLRTQGLLFSTQLKIAETKLYQYLKFTATEYHVSITPSMLKKITAQCF